MGGTLGSTGTGMWPARTGVEFMKVIALTSLAVLSSPLAAQDASPATEAATEALPAVQPAPAPMPIQARKMAANQAMLPANTEITLAMNQEVTTKGRKWSEGDTFNLSVVHDVMLGDYVVIPKGSRGVGRITWLTSKGAFGKSGKMDIELEYVQVGGRRIDISGSYRQEGEGNTVATVGGVLLAGVFAGFVTGKSGRIPQGRELTATTDDAIPVTLPEGAAIPSNSAPLQATAPAALPPATEAIDESGSEDTPDSEK